VLISIAHIALAIILFYLINWIGKHSTAYGYLQMSLFVRSDQAPAFNFIIRTVTPTVFIVLVSTACYSVHGLQLVHNIWLVVTYYFVFRIIYNVSLGRTLLLNWLSLSTQTALGIGLAYLAYVYLIVPRHPLFPDAQEVGNQLWVIIALFLYATFNSVRTSDGASVRRKNRYVRARYTKARQLYDDLIQQSYTAHYMELVTYAILIVESFNRPRLIQGLERITFPWGSHTLGPMQIRTDKRISDRESVQRGVKILKESFERTQQELSAKKFSRYDVIRSVLAKYNRDETYIEEVFQVLNILWAQIATEFRPELEHMHMC